MSKSTSKKKVVVTTAKRATPTVSRSKSSSNAPAVRKGSLIFGKKNYLFMLAGIVLIAVGLVLMSGGAMPSPGVWDESIIYSWQRTLLGPLVIIIGLVAEIFAIFNNAGVEDASPSS